MIDGPYQLINFYNYQQKKFNLVKHHHFLLINNNKKLPKIKRVCFQRNKFPQLFLMNQNHKMNYAKL